MPNQNGGIEMPRIDTMPVVFANQELGAVEQRPVRARAEEVRRQMLLEPAPVPALGRTEVLGIETKQDLTIGRRHGQSSSP